jgi:PRC-barrel domain
MMTAANLGLRVTDRGFAIFLLASICWTAIGLSSGQSSLIYANSFLILVNAVGVWRWLGRQAAYEDGPTDAAERSAHEKVPSLFSFSALTSAEIVDQKGKKFGTIVDVMGSVSSHEIAYFVVSEGGIGRLGERLHAVPASLFDLSSDNPSARSEARDLNALADLEPGSWPIRLDRNSDLDAPVPS